MLESLSSTITRTGIYLAALTVGGGVLYHLNLFSMLRKCHKYRQFAGLYKKRLKVPAVFPVYVENSRTIGNICTQIQKGPGVLVLWGPAGSGKSSCVIRTCNELLSKSKIGGLVQVNDSTFSEVGGDGGVQWLNTALGVDNLMNCNDKISSIIPCNEPDDSWYDRALSLYFRRGKRVVILFDQFDNVCEHSNLDMVLKFIKRLAEDSVKHNSYCVLLCVTNPLLAKDILNLNGGKKISLLQKPRDLQWRDSEISKYFDGKPFTETVHLVGTPGFCVDILQQKIQNEEQTGAKICKEWQDGDFLETMMN